MNTPTSTTLGSRFGQALQHQRALLRQPWQARRHNSGWQRPWAAPAVHALAAAVLLALWPGQWRLWLGLLALLWLGWLWWLLADGLLRQNRPALARLLPGHVRALRVQLLAWGVLLTVAAVLVLRWTWGPDGPWLWLAVPALLAVVWLPREPWLWLPVVLLAPWVPMFSWAHEAAAAAPGMKLIALLAAGVLLGLAVGEGGPLHRWHAERCARWMRAARAASEGRATPIASLGLPGRAAAAFFGWPQRLWRRRLLARGNTAPLAPRLELGLGLGGQWADLLWTAALLFGGIGTSLLLAQPARGAAEWREVADFARFGLGVGAFSLVGSALYSRLSRLWERRREQALLVLLPGLPAQDWTALERRWRREYLVGWLAATALVLAVGAAGSAGSLDYAAACAALCLPLPWLAQHQLRRLCGKPRLALLSLAPVLAAALAWPVQLLGVPAWASLAAGGLVYAMLSRRADAAALRLPLGRAGHEPDTMAAEPAATTDPR